MIHSIETKAWFLNIYCPSQFSVSEAILESTKDLKIKDKALTSSFRDRWTPRCRKWGCCIISIISIFSTGRSGFAAFSFLWPQLLLLPLPQPRAKLMVVAVLCFAQLWWFFFSANVLRRGALDPLHWHNWGKACNDREIWIQKVEILWEYGSVISIFLFWWVLVRMREQAADFAKSYEGFPELGSTTFRSSGFWLSLLEIVTAWIWVFP